MDGIDKNTRILIVDDKANMRRTIRNLLRQNGFNRFFEAEDGEAAIKALSLHNIDIILCDWNMPRMSGIDLLRTLKGNEQFRNIPFLMITAEIYEDTVAEAGEIDVDGYIIKPFTSETVLEKMQIVWDRKNNPSPVDVELELGWIHYKSQNFNSALKQFKGALKLNNRSPRTYHALGLAYEAKKNYKNAIESYKNAIKLAPKFLRAHESLTDIYAKLGESDKSVFYLEQVCKISPRNIKRQIALGKKLITLDRKDHARQLFISVLKQQTRKDYSDIAVQIGEALLDVEMFVEAEMAFRQGLNADPKDILLYNRLAIALRRQGRHEESINTYYKALEIEPDNETVYYNLSKALYSKGDHKGAIDAIEKSLEIFPDFEEALELFKVLSKDKKTNIKK